MPGAFLLTWSPEAGGDISEFVDAVARGRATVRRWSTGATTRAIHPGDRAYLLRQGSGPRGLVASGDILTDVGDDERWDGSGRIAHYVDVRWTDAVPLDDPLPLAALELHASAQHWRPQASGSRIRPELMDAVAELWAAHLAEFRDGG